MTQDCMIYQTNEEVLTRIEDMAIHQNYREHITKHTSDFSLSTTFSTLVLMRFLVTLGDLHTILSTHTSFSSIVLDAQNLIVQKVLGEWSAQGIQCFVGGGMKS